MEKSLTLDRQQMLASAFSSHCPAPPDKREHEQLQGDAAEAAAAAEPAEPQVAERVGTDGRSDVSMHDLFGTSSEDEDQTHTRDPNS